MIAPTFPAHVGSRKAAIDRGGEKHQKPEGL
jgi:hypothetical protein